MRIPTTLLAASLWVGSLSSQPTEDGIYAIFDTTEGEITARLFYKKAPISCANFVGLAEGSIILWNSEGEPITGPFYSGLTFHRAISDFLIQGGDPLQNGTGGPGYYWPDEVRPDLTHDKAGILSVANAGPNTNGSQFFFTLEAVPEFDGLYNVFGEVIEGLENVQKISSLPVTDEESFLLQNPVTLSSVTILRIGEEALAFNYADKLFPERFAADVELIHQSQAVPLIRIHSAAQSRYIIEASDDLANWSDIGTITGKFNQGDTHDLSFIQNIKDGKTAQFVRVSEIYGHLTRDASESKLTVTTGSVEDPYIETIDFGFDQIAIYSVPSLGFSSQCDYAWYELPDGRSQVWLSLRDSTASIPEYQFFLDWTSNSEGNVYIRDATPEYYNDPENPANNSPDDWVLEGTFTYE